VKLKNREVPLFNLCQVFRLQPSREENPLVILIKGKEDRPAAIIIDQVISREEIEYQPIEGRPYIFGQGISKRGKTWILDAEQISP
jgi:chemotaxis signal transduction protein